MKFRCSATWAGPRCSTSPRKRSVITTNPEDFEKRGVDPGDSILIHTGWDRYIKPLDETYFNLDHPHFSEAAIDWALQRKIELIGMDTPSTDPYLEDHPKIIPEKGQLPDQARADD